MTVSRRSFIGAIAAVIGLGSVVPKAINKTTDSIAIDIEGSGIIAIDLVEGDYYRPISQEAVKRLAKQITTSRILRPVTIGMMKGRYFCIDGWHRVKAMEYLGAKTIPCRFVVYNGAFA